MDQTTKPTAPEQPDAAAKPAFWAVLPAAVRYDEELPPNAKLLYAEISALTNQLGYCYASNAYFENLYSLSERTIIRLIQALAESGYIRVEDNGGGKAQRKIYAGINPLFLTPDKNVSTPLTKMSVPPDKNVTHNKKDINTEDHIPPKPPRGSRAKKEKPACEYAPEMFERFWKMYPRGEDKAAARYEWDLLRPDLTLMRIMSAALKSQMKTDEWQRGVGIPYACRWLSKRRWEAAEKLAEQQKAGSTPVPIEEAEIWL